MLWTTGVGMQKVVERFVHVIDQQKHSRAIVVDDRLRVIGVYQGPNTYADANIFAIGDASTIAEPKLIEHMMEFFTKYQDKTGTVSFEEFKCLCKDMKKQYPQTGVYLVTFSFYFIYLPLV